ncbi:replication initiator protein [Microviridae sp.]|nr:replication initiator protein [Microviridae sp.]
MPCFKPVNAWRGTNGSIVFDKNKSLGISITLPCGQCIDCRLEKSRQWATRCMHEASQYDDNCFITLTYNNKNIPYDYSLTKPHFQKFMKRLRKKYEPKKIRFYQCGEYGEPTPENNYIARPHYHALLFNHDFKDKIKWKKVNDQTYFLSKELSALWPFGFSTIGTVTFESAAYCARYIMKKINGDQADEHYKTTCHYTGQTFDRLPEYATMSRRPGLGASWYDDFKSDCYPSDYIFTNGVRVTPPPYYDELLRREDPELIAHIKELRMKSIKKHKKDLTPERLAVREEVVQARISKLQRNL